MTFSFPVIGRIESCFNEKFGTPRQPGLAAHARARLVLEPPYNRPDALEGLEACSHIWVQFVFHANRPGEWSPRVRPPRLGGNRRLGVFATRSPFRPSPIGLSVVRLTGIHCQGEDCWLELAGVDMIDGTPVLDIKPYLPWVDAVPEATHGFAGEAPPLLPVNFGETAAAQLAQLAAEDVQLRQLQELLVEVLQQDPRPAYQQPNPERTYGMRISGLNVRWHYQVAAGVATAIDIISIGRAV